MQAHRAAAVGCFVSLCLLFTGCNDKSSSQAALPLIGSIDLNAAHAFQTGTPDLQDLVIECTSPDRLYTLEFDFNGDAWVKTFQIDFDGQLTLLQNTDLATAMAGSLANDLSIFAPGSALVVAQAAFGGGGTESLHAFDPRDSTPSVSSRDVGADSVVAPFIDMAGDALTLIAETGDTLSSVTVNFLEDAVLFDGRIYAITSNVDFSSTPTARHPGTIHIYGFDESSNTILSRQGVMFTGKSGAVAQGVYNPSALAQARISGRDLLVVACAGSFAGDGAVEVFDLNSHQTVASLSLAGTPFGVVSVDEGAGLIYVGDGNNSRIHALKLSFSGSSASLSAVAGSPFLLPDGNGGDAFQPGGLAVSSDGKRLAGVNFWTNAVTVYSVSSGVPTALVTTSIQHDSVNVPNNQRSIGLAMRCGTPSIDFSGPDLFFGVIDLDPPAQTLNGVGSAVDSGYSY